MYNANEEMANETVKRGRPPKEQAKKGTKSWSPSNLGDILEKEPGFRYRKVRKDDDNIAKKKDEQWEFVSGVNGYKTSTIQPAGRPDEPHKITSNVEGRDWILMRMPDEAAEQRDAFYQDKVKRLERRLTRQTQDELSKDGATMHGSITKEHKGYKTVIE